MPPAGSRRREHLASQPGLAHAGRSGDDDAGRLRRVDCLQDGPKLLIAADERPPSFNDTHAR